jgi:tetratricopeptide (TPR) repeat protein
MLVLVLAWAPVRADEAGASPAPAVSGESQAALLRAEVAEAAVARQPGDAQALFHQGVALMDLHRDDEALALFLRMTGEYPELPDPYNNIALLEVRRGHLELARQALESALRNDPGHRIARANLGQVHLMLAVQAWELAAAGSPLDAALQRQLEGARALLAAAGVRPR